jgi:hypothetical protein|nr:MAG TPA: capsid protein [Caudoviricetes sp.]
MNLTIDSFLGHVGYVKSVADRALATERNKIILGNYMSFEYTPNRIFKSVYMETSAVRMGSVIDRNAGKVLRGRAPMGEATLEVADLGDRFQMDNDRLEKLSDVIKQVNAGKLNYDAVVNTLVDDFRDASIAPYKRAEKILFDLLFNGKSEVTTGDNPNGVSILDMEIPIIKAEAKAGDKDNLVEFLVNLRNKYSHINFGTMEMSQATFFKYFAKSKELMGKYKMSLGGAEVSMAGIIPLEAVNAIMTSLGLPAIRVVNNIVTDLSGATAPLCPDDKIVFLPEGEIGKMRFYEPYELRDPVPTKTYTALTANHLISTQRTDEGRFIEYACAWIPEVRLPKHILSVDLKAIKS